MKEFAKEKNNFMTKMQRAIFMSKIFLLQIKFEYASQFVIAWVFGNYGPFFSVFVDVP